MQNTFGALLVVLLALGCAKKPESESSQTAKALYVASGVCYSGAGVTTFTTATASNLVYRVSLANGQVDEILADYNTAAEIPASSPVGLAAMGSGKVGILVENATAGARKLEILDTSSKARTLYYTNATAFASVLKDLHYVVSENAFLISENTAIEKINSTPARDLKGANPWVNNPGNQCVNSNLNISSVKTLTNGKIVYAHTHAATAANRKLGIISANGYSVVGDCLNGSAITITSNPVAIEYLPGSNQLLVLTAGSTAGSTDNALYVYDVNETANTIANPTTLMVNNGSAVAPTIYAPYLFGASAMAFDSSTNSLYIAVANSTATTVQNYNIEKFTYDPTAKTITRVGNTPFATGWIGSKCIASMVVQ